MGAGMARSLLRAGLPTTVWNRDRAKARKLADDGAQVADDVAAALADADVVVTMLFDADAVAQVLEGPIAAGAFGGSAVWLQMTTTGTEGTMRLNALAEQHGVAFLDAPVLGSRKPAEDGTLTVLCSGSSDLRDRVSPALDAMGSRTVWVGEQAGQASALKLVCNAWTITLTDATAQSVALAQGLGLDPTSFLDVIRGGGTDSGYVQMKGKAMIEGSTDVPAFSLSGARKDMGLIQEALAGSGTDTRLADTVLAHFDQADAAGYADHDNAAVVHVYR